MRRTATEGEALPRQRWMDYRLLAEITPADLNPKGHDDALIDSSIDKHGYVEPIQMDERTGKLVAGHGRLESLQRKEAAGAEAPDGIDVDDQGRWVVPIVRGWASRDDLQARSYLLLSNRAGEKGGWRERELAEYLHDLDTDLAALEAGDSERLAELGWSDAEYDALLQETGLKGELEGDFLSDLDDGSVGSGPGQTSRAGAGTDAVDLRLPMTPADRDDAVALLRKHQRALADANRPAGSLSATALEIFRTWAP